MSKNESTTNTFTFKNYLRYWAKSWLFILIFVIIGLVGGFVYTKTSKVSYSANFKVLVHNAGIDQGAAVSPYIQFKEIFTSEKIVKDLGLDINTKKITIEEMPRGVFTITAKEDSAKKALSDITTISDNIDKIASAAYSDSENYETSILSISTEATPSTTTQKNILMIIIAGLAMVFIASIILFIKFDFSTEKK